jgi:hypothetical protein
MPATLEQRISKLETQMSGSGGRCPHGVYTIWPDDTTIGERVCPICGRPRPNIMVVYDE